MSTCERERVQGYGEGEGQTKLRATTVCVEIRAWRIRSFAADYPSFISTNLIFFVDLLSLSFFVAIAFHV
jgi:hypothetical protein